MLKAVNISYEFEYFRLFNQLNFEVGQNQVLHVSGHNGAGKTTLLKLLAGVIPLNLGVVSYQGIDINKNLVNYQQQITYISHRDLLCNDLTVKENCQFNCFAALPCQTIDYALNAVGLDAYSDETSVNLSAGQRRRLNLSRLWLESKPIWILDEPYTALDSDMIEKVNQRIISHCQQGGIVILTSHQNISFEKIDIKQVHLS